MTETEHTQQPRKRLFILLLGVGVTLVLGLAFLLWWVPSVGLEHIHPVLPIIFGVILSLLSFFIVSGLALLVLTLLTGRDLFMLQSLRGLVVCYLFPAIISLGKLFGVDRDILQQSFIALNNQLVHTRRLRVPAERTLILLPHCLQMFDCAIKITGDVEKCVHCGKCDIHGLLELAHKFGIEMAVATGGTLARKLIVDKRPKLIVAVACERDLTSGIRDSYPLPVVGILNKRPNGPCFNTNVLLPEVEQALKEYIIPAEKAGAGQGK